MFHQPFKSFKSLLNTFLFYLFNLNPESTIFLANCNVLILILSNVLHEFIKVLGMQSFSFETKSASTLKQWINIRSGVLYLQEDKMIVQVVPNVICNAMFQTPNASIIFMKAFGLTILSLQIHSHGWFVFSSFKTSSPIIF